MALKKHEQAQLDMIQKSLDMLVNIGGMTNDDMLTHLNPMIAGFEAETNMKVVIAPTESGKPVLDVVDLKKDFVGTHQRHFRAFALNLWAFRLKLKSRKRMISPSVTSRLLAHCANWPIQ